MSAGTHPRKCEYKRQGDIRYKPQLICDGIYPRAPLFVHSIENTKDEKESYFTLRQKAQRKKIERAFWFLQAKFHIIALPSRLWSAERMDIIMYHLVIICIMIEDESRPLYGEVVDYNANVRLGDDVGCCFETRGCVCLWGGLHGVERGTIAAISGVSQSHSSYLTPTSTYECKSWFLSTLSNKGKFTLLLLPGLLNLSRRAHESSRSH